MTPEQIHAAAARAKGHIRETPLLNAPLLDRIAKRRIFVKAESLQITGSFKARGAWAAVSALGPKVTGVLAMSSGNHAQGVAWAAAQHGKSAVIVMPKDAPAVKIANTRAYGGEVVLYDRDHEDRDGIATSLATSRGLALIPPYDHAEVIAGQGTVGLEIAAQARAAEIGRAAVLAPCGGGGLSAGIALALSAAAPELTFHTAEPEGFDDMARSLAAGKRLRNAATSGSLCDAILTPTPGALTFPLLAPLAGPGFAVSDAEALEAMILAFRTLRLVLEPGGAVALAAALFRDDLPETVICVASGGNVDEALFARHLAA